MKHIGKVTLLTATLLALSTHAVAAETTQPQTTAEATTVEVTTVQPTTEESPTTSEVTPPTDDKSIGDVLKNQTRQVLLKQRVKHITTLMVNRLLQLGNG